MAQAYFDWSIPTQIEMLKAVREWLPGMFMLEECKALFHSNPWKQGGRIDAVLIPLTQYSPSYKQIGFSQGITGIECKRTRSDFLAGTKRGQFELYDKQLSGLYICTTHKICKSSEIKKEYSHLVIIWKRKENKYVCICRRHPQFKKVELNQQQVYRILWAGMNLIYNLSLEKQEIINSEIENIKMHGSRIIGRLIRRDIINKK